MLFHYCCTLLCSLPIYSLPSFSSTPALSCLACSLPNHSLLCILPLLSWPDLSCTLPSLLCLSLLSPALVLSSLAIFCPAGSYLDLTRPAALYLNLTYLFLLFFPSVLLCIHLGGRGRQTQQAGGVGNTLSRQGVKYTQQAGGKIRSRLHQDPGALCCLRVNPSCYTGVLNLVAGGEAAGYTWGLVVVEGG